MLQTISNLLGVSPYCDPCSNANALGRYSFECPISPSRTSRRSWEYRIFPRYISALSLQVTVFADTSNFTTRDLSRSLNGRHRTSMRKLRNNYASSTLKKG